MKTILETVNQKNSEEAYERLRKALLPFVKPDRESTLARDTRQMKTHYTEHEFEVLLIQFRRWIARKPMEGNVRIFEPALPHGSSSEDQQRLAFKIRSAPGEQRFDIINSQWLNDAQCKQVREAWDDACESRSQ